MSIQETAKQNMYAAMKEHDKQKKDAYAMLYDQLKKKEIDLRHPLTDDEEIAVVAKMVKQCKDSIDSVPEDKGGKFLEKVKFEMEIYSQFLPVLMTEDEITVVVKETMTECGIETLDNKTRGLLMKNLMPKVKGKADGKLVADTVNKMM